jgi:hypothetical protein
LTTNQQTETTNAKLMVETMFYFRTDEENYGLFDFCNIVMSFLLTVTLSKIKCGL